MRSICFILSLFITGPLSDQRNISPTDTLHILGQVETPKIFSITDLEGLSKINIPDQVIYNQKGEVKDTLIGLKGIPLKTLLARVKLVYEKPKDLNEFYFVLKGSDGYTVVLSWNEIYNTVLGDQFFIITEEERKRLNEIGERILFIDTGDLKAGRRYIRGLDRIEVKRSE